MSKRRNGLFVLILFLIVWFGWTWEVASQGVSPGSVISFTQSNGTQTGASPQSPSSGSSQLANRQESQRVSRPDQKPDGYRKSRKAKKLKRRKSIESKALSQCQTNRSAVKPTTEDDGSTHIISKKIGSAPILKNFIDRMEVVSIIDRLVPPHPGQKISHGERVAALMVYMLNGGRALYNMEKWAAETHILQHIFPQYTSSDWTDDRLGKTLDALNRTGLESIQGSISSHIIMEFDLKLDEIHYDTTSVTLWGTYDSRIGESALVITYGHAKNGRSDLKQLVEGMAVTGDGSVPIISGTHDGNTSDSVLPVSYWERLGKVADKTPFCFIGDCKIASVKTLSTLCRQDGEFLSPLAMTASAKEKLITRMEAGELNFEPVNLANEPKLSPIYERLSDRPGNRRQKDKASEGSDSYKVVEESWEIKDKSKDKENGTHTIRKLILYGSRLARLNANTRQNRLEKAEKELTELNQKLNKRKLKTREAIDAAVKNILNKRKVTGLIDVAITQEKKGVRKQIGRGRPGPNTRYEESESILYDLKFVRNQQEIKKKSLLDGIFMMVTNRDKKKWTPASLLALYKRQYKVEKVHSVMKGPLAVTPMLLEKPERMCSMMFITTLTLQLYTLIQREVASELLKRNEPLAGLMPNKIKTWRPQTDTLLAAFDNINLIIVGENKATTSYWTSLNTLQREILKLLDVPQEKYNQNTGKYKFEKT